MVFFCLQCSCKDFYGQIEHTCKLKFAHLRENWPLNPNCKNVFELEMSPYSCCFRDWFLSKICFCFCPLQISEATPWGKMIKSCGTSSGHNYWNLIGTLIDWIAIKLVDFFFVNKTSLAMSYPSYHIIKRAIWDDETIRHFWVTQNFGHLQH